MPYRFRLHFLWVFGLASLLPIWSQTDRVSYPTLYHNYDEVEKKLQDWSQNNKHATLLEIGKSAGGQPIYVLAIAAAGEIASSQRQAVFVGANIVGNRQTGTEAALHLISHLLDSDNDKTSHRIKTQTFYIAPVLNPDTHGRFFANPRIPTHGNAGKVDRDRDGFFGEDDFNDLNNDGMITKMRILDPSGRWLIDPDEPMIMRKADAKEGEQGTHKLLSEGDDDDQDGEFNEDIAAGMDPSINFAHGFAYDNRSAGPWPSAAPEAKAIMDFLLKRPQIALAVVYGPANYFLSPPRGFGGSADTGNLKLEIPKTIAEYLGFDPDKKYSLDEIWEVAKNFPEVKQNNLTKDDVAQFLGVGPATKPTGEDLEALTYFADKYKKRLEEAKLDTKRQAKQDRPGGFSSWLYFQYGAVTVELDVWGVPKAPEPKKEEENKDALTIEKLEQMSSDDFIALGEEKIEKFLKDNKVPAQYSAKMVLNMISSGQADPKRIAGMMKQMGAGPGASKEDGKRDDLLIFAKEHAPWAIASWTQITLADGRKAEVGGIDRFLAINPPYEHLAKALEVHTATVLEMSDHLAKIAIVKTRVTKLGNGVYRLMATAGNTGFLASHTGLAKKAKNHLPIRLGLVPGNQFTVLHGPKWATSESLAGHQASLSGEWILKANSKNPKVELILLSDHAGQASQEIDLIQGDQ